MSGPLGLRFVVTCRPETAFRLWTEGIGKWWPADHTVSGDPAAVVFEGRVGGRVFERARDGSEYEWGRVTLWEPPSLLGYTWYLGGESDDATDVRIGFCASGDDSTVVEIQHQGWERLGTRAEAWRERNRSGWESLIPHLIQAASSDVAAAFEAASRPKGT